MPLESPKILEPEIVTPNLVSKFIRATNAIWNLTYYDKLLTYPDMQVVVTTNLPDQYLNSAQEITTSNLELIENRLLQEGISAPSIYVDPNTPGVLLEKMKLAEYHIQEDQTEIWRILDIRNRDVLLKNIEVPVPDMAALDWNVEDIPDQELQEFLRIDKETNQIDDATILQLKNNLKSKRDPNVRILILLTKVNMEYSTCLCLGIADGVGVISEAGTLEKYRGKGVYPWLKAHAVIIAKEMGCEWVVSSVLEWNTSSQRSSDKSGFIRGFERQLYVKSKDE